MPTCQNCKTKWRWKETIRKSFSIDPGMVCPYCGEKQYVTQKTRKRTYLLLLFPALILLLNIVIDLQPAILIAALIGCFLLYVCVYPFLIELSSQEE